jgi:hypothetical protein
MPSDPSDTSTAVMEMMIERWRTMSPAEKFQAVAAANQASEAMSAAGVRRRYPTADEAEVRRRVIALRLGRELSVAVYGWDPEVHGW